VSVFVRRHYSDAIAPVSWDPQFDLGALGRIGFVEKIGMH